MWCCCLLCVLRPTQDVCSAGVCEKDFDINLLDGDVDDDATSCPTKSELIDLIGSIALSSTCFSGPSADGTSG